MMLELEELGATLTNPPTHSSPSWGSVEVVHMPSVLSSAVMDLHGAASWVLEAAMKLHSLGRLQRGWDSHDGLALQPGAREVTVRVLDDLRSCRLPVPSVVLASNGSVHLEWHSRGRELELGFGEGRNVSYVKVNAAGDIEEGEVGARTPDLFQLARWIAGGPQSRNR